MKQIPEGWEGCSPSECTRALLSSGVMVYVNEDKCGTNAEVLHLNVRHTLLELLGITPIRKTQPSEPIEFVIPEFTAPLIGSNVMTVPEGVKPGMRFREVVEN